MPTNRAQYRPREYLRLIFRQAPGAVWATDRDLLLTHVQGRTAMLDEAESRRLVGTTIYDFVGSHDPSEPAIAHHLAALAGGRQSFQYHRHSRWFEVLIEPLLADTGTIVGCVGAAMDITSQRETTQKLHRSVSLLQATLNATADGILVVDRQGHVATCNQRFLTLWRVPPSLGQRGDDAALLSFVSDQLDDSKAFLEAVRDLYASPEQEAFDVLRFKDGRVFERHSLPQLVDREAVGRVWSFRDVTERERLLRRATFLADAARLLSSLDVKRALSSVAHLAVPHLGEICAVDLIHERKPERLLIVGNDGDPDRAPAVHAGALGGHSVIYTAGSRSHMAIPLMCRDEVLGLLTLVAPATRQYTKEDLELCEELGRRIALSIDNARLYEGARKAITGRDEFLSIAAHEIRGPLASIHLAAQSLLRGSLSPSATRTALDVIQREDRRLGRFVEDLLDLGRIRTGQLNFEIEVVDLGTIVRDVVSKFSGGLAQKGSAVTVTTGGALTGQWDRGRLEQVVTNLVSNAVKYGDGKPIQITAERSGDDAILRVADHGMGIETGKLARIFNPFERVVEARHYGGLGLGLHIAKTIVDGLGGTITVDSYPGAGATFTVKLPMSGSAADERTDPGGR
jgi:signal transduction histidine kinase/PAS domain-containing protein